MSRRELTLPRSYICIRLARHDTPLVVEVEARDQRRATTSSRSRARVARHLQHRQSGGRLSSESYATRTSTGSAVASVEQSEAEVLRPTRARWARIRRQWTDQHNTTTLRTIIMALQQRGEKFLLASPTGRAAKRLSEATEAEAMTIHRLLEFYAGRRAALQAQRRVPARRRDGDRRRGQHARCAAGEQPAQGLPQDAHLLLVGDSDQLPSVGPGRVLHDIIDSMAVPSIHLDTIFRQAEGSGIIANAHRINSGEQPRLREPRRFLLLPAPRARALRRSGGRTGGAAHPAPLRARSAPRCAGADPDPPRAGRRGKLERAAPGRAQPARARSRRAALRRNHLPAGRPRAPAAQQLRSRCLQRRYRRGRGDRPDRAAADSALRQ